MWPLQPSLQFVASLPLAAAGSAELTGWSPPCQLAQHWQLAGGLLASIWEAVHRMLYRPEAARR